MGSTADATNSNAAGSNSPGQPSLERVMGPGLLLLFIVGDILGTGIYALTGKVAKSACGPSGWVTATSPG
ncbi:MULTISPECIES: hypothetical protein [unclassified Rhodococcus (in: high G+C Gram-positive bacteria)]|uniref:hypothetical protein n=1 Tax=unclassified Rhodococcus (in: high G+C Gram-positive bacteria) TaxID=192944 RepID=UPI0037C763F7